MRIWGPTDGPDKKEGTWTTRAEQQEPTGGAKQVQEWMVSILRELKNTTQSPLHPKSPNLVDMWQTWESEFK